MLILLSPHNLFVRRFEMVKPTVTIRQKVFIRAKPEQVYDALVNAAEHTAFTGAKATCTPKVGGKFTAWDGYITGTNLKLEKGKRIIQQWKTSEWPSGYAPSTVEFSFTRRSDGTELTMIQSNVPRDQAGSYRGGWIDFYWNPLKEYFGKRKQ
jgi:activator of HSP90 ATPase